MFAALDVLSGSACCCSSRSTGRALMIPWHASHRNDFAATA
jgi:hypothetical protein